MYCELCGSLAKSLPSGLNLPSGLLEGICRSGFRLFQLPPFCCVGTRLLVPVEQYVPKQSCTYVPCPKIGPQEDGELVVRFPTQYLPHMHQALQGFWGFHVRTMAKGMEEQPLDTALKGFPMLCIPFFFNIFCRMVLAYLVLTRHNLHHGQMTYALGLLRVLVGGHVFS